MCFTMHLLCRYDECMSTFRLYPTPTQEVALREHCVHARFVWNLGLEQRLMYRPERGPAPSYYEQARQLTEARHAAEWLAAGSVTVQQEALRDLDQAWRNFFGGTHGRPKWRKAGRNEGFRVVGTQARRVQKLNRRWSQVLVPKIGWVRFRRSRDTPDAKSYRVTQDRAGRWHIAFAVIPQPIQTSGAGEIVGIDRGVAVTLALSTGEMLNAPKPRAGTTRLQRRLSRAKRGSNRRQAAKIRLARAMAKDADRRKDWAEKTSTDIARRFDVIRIEDLKIRSMTRTAKGTIAVPGTNVRRRPA